MSDKKLTVVIPTTLSPDVFELLDNLKGNVPDNTLIYLVIDGNEHLSQEATAKINSSRVKFRERNGVELYEIVLPFSIGKGGWYGHRAIAGFAHMINTPFVTFIDQDNLVDAFHFVTLLELLEKYEDLPFAYSHRTIINKQGRNVCLDECESLGYKPIMGNEQNGYLVDTSSWVYRRQFIEQNGHIWHYGWGADRRFTMAVRNGVGPEIMERACTKLPSLLYRVAGNANSVTPEFFITGNSKIKLLEIKSDSTD